MHACKALSYYIHGAMFNSKTAACYSHCDAVHTAHNTSKKSPTQLDTDLLLHVTQLAVKYSSGGGSAYSPAHNKSPANTLSVACLNLGHGNIIMIIAVIS